MMPETAKEIIAAEIPATESRAEIPLCVDLDGTLLRTDTLYESLLALIKRNVFLLGLLPLWLLRGKAFFKHQLAQRVKLDVTALPYNVRVLAFLRQELEKGRPLILVTATNERIARAIADHVGVFSDVLASDARTNLSGESKAKALVRKFGSKRFDYAGNGAVDLPVWANAAQSIVVGGSKRLIERVREVSALGQVFPQTANIRAILAAIRIHQWMKNGLVFVPLVVSHNVRNDAMAFSALVAFASFSLCASAVYLLNDLLDLEWDRRHDRKRNRPFASGTLPLSLGFWLVPLLLAGGFTIALALPSGFIWVLTAYLALTIAYTLYLRSLVLVDVLLLGTVYTLRIFAGAVAIGVAPSPWLLSFCVFLFFSLALLKRFTELRDEVLPDAALHFGRGYVKSDLETIANMGTAGGYLSVLVLALYLNSKEVSLLYTHPEYLWLICPLLLYWISRIWLLAQRGMMHHDPIVFALYDKNSYVLGLLAVGIMLWAK